MSDAPLPLPFHSPGVRVAAGWEGLQRGPGWYPALVARLGRLGRLERECL